MLVVIVVDVFTKRRLDKTFPTYFVSVTFWLVVVFAATETDQISTVMHEVALGAEDEFGFD